LRGLATTFTEHEDGFHAPGRDAERVGLFKKSAISIAPFLETDLVEEVLEPAPVSTAPYSCGRRARG
jgi:hypothetical protein